MQKRTTHMNYSKQNVHSSRSHAFLTLVLDRHSLHGSQVTSTDTTRMCLVDLAGSEKFDESYKDEGGKINASLLALGKVGSARGWRDAWFGGLLGCAGRTYACACRRVRPHGPSTHRLPCCPPLITHRAVHHLPLDDHSLSALEEGGFADLCLHASCLLRTHVVCTLCVAASTTRAAGHALPLAGVLTPQRSARGLKAPKEDSPM